MAKDNVDEIKVRLNGIEDLSASLAMLHSEGLPTWYYTPGDPTSRT